MKYLVYFDGTHVVILDEQDIMFMDYEDYSIEANMLRIIMPQG